MTSLIIRKLLICTAFKKSLLWFSNERKKNTRKTKRKSSTTIQWSSSIQQSSL